MKEYLQDLLPKCCISVGCLRQKSRDQDLKKARERFTEEMDLVWHLQKMRYFSAAISVLLFVKWTSIEAPERGLAALFEVVGGLTRRGKELTEHIVSIGRVAHLIGEY